MVPFGRKEMQMAELGIAESRRQLADLSKEWRNTQADFGKKMADKGYSLELISRIMNRSVPGLKVLIAKYGPTSE